ncbi:MAG: hypothetical protein U5K75_08565 [Ahrensia sp.]|nr:hypothetical protein [Ahrensia sp.]
MRDFSNYSRPVYEAPNESGTGEPSSAPNAAGSATANAWSPPEGLPESFRGADASRAITKLLGGYNESNTRFNGIREKLANMPKAPETIDGYVYQPSDALKPYFGDDLTANPAIGC